MCESSSPKADRRSLLGHHSQVRREAMGLWCGDEGAQTTGSLRCLFFTFFFVINKNHMFLEGASRGREDSGIVYEFLIQVIDSS